MKRTSAARAIVAMMTMTLGSAPLVALPTTLKAKASVMPRIPVDDSRRVARAALKSAPDQALLLRIDAELLKYPRVKQIDRINEWVNRTIDFADDRNRLGVADHGATPRETLSDGKGDCEDYAILKMELLHAAGVPLEAMHVLIVEEPGFIYHAKLMVEVGDEIMILDNRTNETRHTSAAMEGSRFALGVDEQFALRTKQRRSSRVRSAFPELGNDDLDLIVTTG